MTELKKLTRYEVTDSYLTLIALDNAEDTIGKKLSDLNANFFIDTNKEEVINLVGYYSLLGEEDSFGLIRYGEIEDKISGNVFKTISYIPDDEKKFITTFINEKLNYYSVFTIEVKK